MTNIHHLELFYYVARHGGISEAVRKIPYGIQQPAVSAQVLQLEDSLGTKLFDRRPFKLTPAGEKLYQFIEPFFSTVETVTDEIRGHASRFIRMGASSTILHNHFPDVLRAVRKKVPGLKLSLHDAIEPDLLAGLERQEIDLAVTVMHGQTPAFIKSQPLIRLTLALIVPAESKIKSPAELWKRDKIEDALICLPSDEAITKNFATGLRQLDVDWPPSFVVNSLDLVETYVQAGFGIGVSVHIPGAKLGPGVRRVPLGDGFEPVVIGALWTGKPTPLMKTVLDELQLRAKALVGGGEAQAV
ncbi:MAG: LysR family transcriptional regulator [Verrucomicrobia bacterium]|nr:LysR family transcriptional regulator [Verrucomicrobiota bacterium]